MRRRTYIEFFLPGLVLSDTDAIEVTPKTLANLPVPKNAFAFCYYHILETEAPDGTVLKSDRLGVSGRYYIGGRVLTLADVKQEMPGERILIDNMEGNGWDRVIQTPLGNFQPFLSQDMICGMNGITGLLAGKVAEALP